ncbi:baculoviral IAP repeat-containing protein 3 isoform X1 [Patella vulgata]|uniref:baculoviral IAP repeat-containing protein 3 isoform X1 n=2 Tax=Patella vulgata TaxID=6465 RepID=UPI00217FE0C8|nr:baculoviral IAP repeat-containing protein 3 isoform X1 [Patella vulgata]
MCTETCLLPTFNLKYNRGCQRRMAAVYRSEQLQTEVNRLETFRRWPLRRPLPLDLARAGFYYSGSADEVRCAFCDGVLKNWKCTDDPWTEHNVKFPHCLFVQHKADFVERYRPKPTGITKYIDFTKEENRLNSFVNWPNSRQSPESLARAGFYYLSNGDMVQCFACRCILKFWENEDDPWIEHAKWSPDCQYLQMCLGKDIFGDSQSAQRQNTRTTLRTETSTSQTETGHVQMNHGASTSLAPVPAETCSGESPLILAVLDMGFTPQQIEAACRERNLNNEPAFASSEEMLSFLMEQGENEFETRNEDFGALKEEKVSMKVSSKDSNFSDDQYLCKICMDSEVAITFIPCGHLVCCFNCAKTLSLCPICRSSITDRVQTHFS